MAQELTYNNSLFSFSGKLNRLFYFFHSSFWSLFSFRFIYYPILMAELQGHPDFSTLVDLLSSHSETSAIVPYLTHVPSTSLIFVILRYACLIPLRLVDFKRIRDLISRELSLIEKVVIAVVLSIPYVDFLSIIILTALPSRALEKQHLDKVNEMNSESNKKSAKLESFLLTNKRMFESGKISRAEYEKNRKKYEDTSL